MIFSKLWHSSERLLTLRVFKLLTVTDSLYCCFPVCSPTKLIPRVGASHRCSSAQCCQLSDFVTRFSDFSDPFSDFFFLKRLATNLATFGKTLPTFQMSPVLSCEREILSYTSPCVCSDQGALAPAERSSTFSDRMAADIDVNQLRMCTRCCHGPITCLLLLCLK